MCVPQPQNKNACGDSQSMEILLSLECFGCENITNISSPFCVSYTLDSMLKS